MLDDGTNEEWTDFYPSGEEITQSHTYNFYGTFVLRAKAKDIHGLVGPEGTLPVTISKSTQQSTTGSSISQNSQSQQNSNSQEGNNVQKSSSQLFFQILGRLLNTR